MTAGIPGTGISVIFYLVSIVMMLVYEGLTTSKKRPANTISRTVGLQFKIVLWSAVSLWLWGWIASYLLVHLADFVNKSLSLNGRFHWPIHPLLIALAVWLVVTISVEAAGFFLNRLSGDIGHHGKHAVGKSSYKRYPTQLSILSTRK